MRNSGGREIQMTEEREKVGGKLKNINFEVKKREELYR